ncbi:RipA family octameric membrane protein [Rhodococcus daqingensis]|uniref:Small integral membrane protein n=1 Tax=Rhodococcus daqingensis TaxID=2479363 RepID=A0ABW2RZM7_9NOCA
MLEQYRLYVEMADRVSARRGLANSFFLTLNTGIFTFVAAFAKAPPQDMAGWLAIPLAAILGQCFAWFYLVRSYRLLNSAKYQVVGALEERLPASPFWRAEWWALGEGKDRSRYWPLSHIEQWIPILFALAYVAGFLAIVFA